MISILKQQDTINVFDFSQMEEVKEQIQYKRAIGSCAGRFALLFPGKEEMMRAYKLFPENPTGYQVGYNLTEMKLVIEFLPFFNTYKENWAMITSVLGEPISD